MVHPNGIGAEGRHESSIELALIGVDQRVLVNELVGDT